MGVFDNTQLRNYKNKAHVLHVLRIGSIGIKRYIKIKADANPYLPEYGGYFAKRRKNKENKLRPAMSAREYRAMASA